MPRLDVHTNHILAHIISFVSACSFTFLVVALATTVSSLVDEGTVVNNNTL